MFCKSTEKELYRSSRPSLISKCCKNDCLRDSFLPVANKINLPAYLSDFPVNKVVLSASPALNPNFIVMAISSTFIDTRKLAIYKSGNFLCCSLVDYDRYKFDLQ
ncbi:hypothetical protein FRX31_005162 [Thalictrum thalictroides]|uniref:Uncharacterized protein n=1 Tax=Thalictrum thalictroides TaxID=46969 RepID=A0A7J6X774_THATH|nr:hypothetical protein FRX31_005162 [Thalictrum thalictroides]